MTRVRRVTTADRTPPLLRMRSRRVAAGLVLDVAGDLDLTTAEEFLAGARQVIRRATDEAVAVLLDLRGVDCLSAAGLRALAVARGGCVAAGRPLLVIADQESVLRPMRVTGMDRAIAVLPSFPSTAAESRDLRGGG